jgi:hypothetical protein
MFTKALVTIAALGVISAWYLRSKAPRFDRNRLGSAEGPDVAVGYSPLESANVGERLQQSHALGAGAGIEPPTSDGPEAPGDVERPSDATWPASREFLRGA